MHKQAGVRPTVYRGIVVCLSKMCIVSKKKISDKCLHHIFLVENNTRQYEEVFYQIVSQRSSELFDNAEDISK